jgi:hypothetical protein
LTGKKNKNDKKKQKQGVGVLEVLSAWLAAQSLIHKVNGERLCLLQAVQADDSRTVVGIPVDTGQLVRKKNLKKMSSGFDLERGVEVTKSPCEVLCGGGASHRQSSSEVGFLNTNYLMLCLLYFCIFFGNNKYSS